MEKDLYWQVLLFRKCVIEQFNFYLSIKTEGLSDKFCQNCRAEPEFCTRQHSKEKKSANNHINIISEVIRVSKDEKTVVICTNQLKNHTCKCQAFSFKISHKMC